MNTCFKICDGGRRLHVSDRKKERPVDGVDSHFYGYKGNME